MTFEDSIARQDFVYRKEEQNNINININVKIIFAVDILPDNLDINLRTE